MPHCSIAIVGAGFSGTLLSLYLQSSSPAGTRIYLIERSGRFATGLAYGSCDPAHLLNVPAGRMGAFADAPLDFLGWLRKQPASRLGGVVPTEGAFVSRALYGCYLRHLLEQACWDGAQNPLELIHDQVLGIENDRGGLTLQMASRRPLTADFAIIATGNPPPRRRIPMLACWKQADCGAPIRGIRGRWRGLESMPQSCLSAPV